MSETKGYVPPEAQPAQPEAQSEQVEVAEINLSNPEFVEQAETAALEQGIEDIEEAVFKGAGTDVADEAILAKEALAKETSGGFLSSIKQSKTFKRITGLVVVASLAFSIAATAKAEAGPSPEGDTTEDVDQDGTEPSPEKISVEDSTKIALDEYKLLLHPDHYQTLEDCVNAVLNSEIPDDEKSKGVAKLFSTLLETPDTEGDDGESAHARAEKLLDSYNSAETEEEQLDILKQYGKARVKGMMQKGATFASDTESMTVGMANHPLEISVDNSGDEQVFTITDKKYGDQVTFELGS